MSVLPSLLRRELESAVLGARRASEGGSRAAVEGLGVFADRRPEHLDAGQALLRNGLRAKWRQLGGDRELLVAECAYEQWHRLLFARFLAENGLLVHPEFRAPVTLAECEELASELGEPDGWSVAARFASEILPGIFRLDDPCVRLRLAPEGRHALEEILAGIPSEVFGADDALGWVYQFWQKDKKDEVNHRVKTAGLKVGGADLGPVTQLFTENYMVRFLLENSLGAWWAARYPDSPLVKGFEYLRFDDGGLPAAGSFDEWPDRVAEVSVMDPCCGSGHFLVEAFSMLWRMRAEEEGLNPTGAQDAVLRDNLFGLELDPRCVEIAMMAVALQAWKAGGGWRELPMPNIACSGIPVKAPVDEWKALADGDERLENALVRLHILFRDADTLGSLIDPKRAIEITDPTGLQQSFEDVEWDEISPLLEQAAGREADDPATAVLGADAAGIARAADYLTRTYTLVMTNPPFLGHHRQSQGLKIYCESQFKSARHDLSLAMVAAWHLTVRRCETLAAVTPSEWQFVGRMASFRKDLFSDSHPRLVVRLGYGAFETPLRTNPTLLVAGLGGSSLAHIADVSSLAASPVEKQAALCTAPLLALSSGVVLADPGRAVAFHDVAVGPGIGRRASAAMGISTGDAMRFERQFWEVTESSSGWERLQSSVSSNEPYGGRSRVILWEDEAGSLAELAASVRHLNHAAQNWRRGKPAWGRSGVAVSTRTQSLPVAIYTGDRYSENCCAVVPSSETDLGALWCFLSSPDFADAVRQRGRGLVVPPSAILQVPFDVERWRRVAEERFPDGLPEPWSDDPTQWLFEGRPEVSTSPLQVAVARLVGFRWPEQVESDDLDELLDADGIVCLPSVAGEAPAADRVQRLLAAAFGDAWSPGMVKRLLEEAGSKKNNLVDWLRDDFFKQHCAMFGNRPFVWHVWDGQRDGFSALVNYHRLDRKTLEKLTYTYLGTDWVERQRAEARDEVAGAEARLAAALDLQGKLEAILNGEEPVDIFVRWKETNVQPIGWEPDLNDGVRLNIRPFIEAGVLRSKFNIHWRKDRGKNPDGSERHNDIHLTLTEKQTARQKAGRT